MPCHLRITTCHDDVLTFLLGKYMWCSTLKGGTLWKLLVSHFITMIMVNVSHILLFVFWKFTIRWIPTFNRQHSIILEDLFQETINRTTKNMANIDHYHDDEMRHIKLLQDPPFQCAASHIWTMVGTTLIQTNSVQWKRKVTNSSQLWLQHSESMEMSSQAKVNSSQLILV